MSYIPEPIAGLIEQLKKLPGVGSRTAERYAFDMIEWEKEELLGFASMIQEVKTKLSHCTHCGALVSLKNCPYCTKEREASGTICVVQSAKDLITFEQTGEYVGVYHVLGGLLSPFNGIGPDSLNLSPLFHKIKNGTYNEVIIALDSTVEGDATALYLKEVLKKYSIQCSRLAFGLPMGSPIAYVDQGTLAKAFLARSQYN